MSEFIALLTRLAFFAVLHGFGRRPRGGETNGETNGGDQRGRGLGLGIDFLVTEK